MASEPYYVVGGTYTFNGTCYQHGSVLDLTSYTVYFVWTLPDETEVVENATVSSAASGTVTYSTTVSVTLSTAGKWQYRWRAVKTSGGNVKLASRPKSIIVHPY